jgi:SAM-dependent methyltransferase
MADSDLMHEVLAEGRDVRMVAEGVYSVLPPGLPSPPYDGRAKLYDRLIGSRAYNRLAWGIEPAAYMAFAKAAADSGEGPLLDAGCGTLVSTARIHAGSARPTVLVDLSIDMLSAARDRLVSIAGRRPDNLVLLQADLRDLPFREQSFGAVLCPGMLHLFEDVESITLELARVARAEARIFASSLVAERRIGRSYLALLHRAGEVARPRSAVDLLSRLHSRGSGLAAPVEARTTGSMSFIIARRFAGEPQS